MVLARSGSEPISLVLLKLHLGEQEKRLLMFCVWHGFLVLFKGTAQLRVYAHFKTAS